MLSIDKEFENVSTQVRYLNEKIIEAFNFFVQLFSAIAGGSVWLSLQPNPMHTDAQTNFLWISNALVGILAFLSIIRIWENLRAWHQYRAVMSRLGGVDETGNLRIPSPRKFRGSVLEGLMILSIAILTGLFWLLNPLGDNNLIDFLHELQTSE